MKLLSLLRKEISHPSLSWHWSESVPGARFAIRQVSLQQRINLNQRLRELTVKHEFLKAGDVSNQLEAGLADLLVAKLYLEWGLVEVQGLAIDGKNATPELLIDHGPERFTDEIVQTIQRELALTEDERKNS